MQQPRDFYVQQLESVLIEEKKLRLRMRMVSLLRLCSFILIIFSVYLFIKSGSPFYGYALIASIVLFILLLRFFSGLRESLILRTKLLFINENELGMMEGRKNVFPSRSGINQPAIYAEDLDIEGDDSLFHMLNRTTTKHGAGSLATVLHQPLESVGDINATQEAIRLLAQQISACQLVTARGLAIDAGASNIDEVRRWFTVPSRMLHKKWLQIVRFALPLINILTLVYYLDTDNPIPAGVSTLATWIIVGSYFGYITAQHVMIGRKYAVLQQYASILKQFANSDTGHSAILNHLHTTAVAGNIAIGKLSSLSSLFDQRLNLLVNLFLNSLLLYDLHVVIALEKWKERHQHDFKSWIEAVGEIESLISISVFTFNHPDFSFPEIKEGPCYIKCTNLGHPLIPSAECVTNDLSVGQNDNLLLITGSNMSGKSTFLRSVGVNLVLAQAGAPVFASSFSFSPMRILTSIRISDSLQDHTSYFMAELKRLRNIMNVIEAGTPALVLVDEVLRGTNTNDKTHGSEALIKKLVKSNAITLFATHDLSLGQLEQHLNGKLSNYCFESIINDGELSFDYKLRRGIARNRNATFLMQKMGIIS